MSARIAATTCRSVSGADRKSRSALCCDVHMSVRRVPALSQMGLQSHNQRYIIVSRARRWKPASALCGRSLRYHIRPSVMVIDHSPLGLRLIVSRTSGIISNVFTPFLSAYSHDDGRLRRRKPRVPRGRRDRKVRVQPAQYGRGRRECNRRVGRIDATQLRGSMLRRLRLRFRDRASGAPPHDPTRRERPSGPSARTASGRR